MGTSSCLTFDKGNRILYRKNLEEFLLLLKPKTEHHRICHPYLNIYDAVKLNLVLLLILKRYFGGFLKQTAT